MEETLTYRCKNNRKSNSGRKVGTVTIKGEFVSSPIKQSKTKQEKTTTTKKQKEALLISRSLEWIGSNALGLCIPHWIPDPTDFSAIPQCKGWMDFWSPEIEFSGLWHLDCLTRSSLWNLSWKWNQKEHRRSKWNSLVFFPSWSHHRTF